ncbi:MAG: single-stranded DNA-binding protein [Microbacterium sp.]
MSDTITITGNVATVPEYKRTPAGVSITTFRVASGQRRYDRASGTWVDAGTNWFTVSSFRGLADHAFQSLRKGDRVVLTGKLRIRQWESGAKQGTTAEIEVEAIGHDLLWGTTTFAKDVRASAPESATAAEAWAPDDAPTGQEPEEGAPAAEWSVPALAPDDARELALTGVDTPF